MKKVWQVTLQIVTDDFETQDQVEDRMLELMSEEIIDCNYCLAELLDTFEDSN